MPCESPRAISKAESAGLKGQTPFSFENFVAKKRKLSPSFRRRGSSPQHSYAFQPTLRWLANRMGLTLTVHPRFFSFSKKDKSPRLFRVWVFFTSLFQTPFILAEFPLQNLKMNLLPLSFSFWGVQIPKIW